LKTILIAGANRGIGREFMRQSSAAGWTVHGTARDEKGLAAVAELGATPHRLDIADDASIAALASELEGIAFDAVFANAGVSGDQHLPVEEIDWAEFHHVAGTNTFGPLRLICALRSNLLLGDRRLALGMSSLMSSISANDWGTQHSYRASKTALNAMWRSLATAWQPDGITCVLLRPGFVATDMTNHKGLAVDVSVAGMLGVLENLTIADTGRVIGYDGLDVPW
jgi:NAD(P)-dependent dehydrogenase (short-subunit alcohol dehydrogenase family)